MPTTKHPRPRAIILLSGGLDSATVLAMARAEGYDCHALSVNYGQRHSSELDAANRVAQVLGAVEHRVIHLDLRVFGGSALTDDAIAVPEAETPGIPVTYVPARNTLMLALALGYAEVIGASDLFIGVNAVDYSGYPDCRPESQARPAAGRARPSPPHRRRPCTSRRFPTLRCADVLPVHGTNADRRR